MTHEVTNQPPPLTGTNAWRGDPLLIQLAEDFSEPVRKDLDTLGRFVLTQEAQDLARLANTETPKLKTHDRQGQAHRPGRVPSRLSCADAPLGRQRPAFLGLGKWRGRDRPPPPGARRALLPDGRARNAGISARSP